MMKHLSLILTFFLCVNGAKASEIVEFEQDLWKTNPCLVMLADEIAQKPDVSFRFRNGVSLRTTAADPDCDDKINENDGMKWKWSAHNETLWSVGLAWNVGHYTPYQ